ncbi:hypothetical protein [Alkalibacillus salilacus]|uniref:ABC transporter permease n=1 Tax=Alkalibacillus salilacus TaxID=284582 RepID=A0ABT9VHT8_9BACI|nr:hypothetical protein [Alkalibacillus salilacus]MDQ0160472.1 hypothetical protein [Alkalibacillus salilacus]
MQTTDRKWTVAGGQYVEQMKWALWFIIIGGVLVRGTLLVVADRVDDQLNEVAEMTLLEFMSEASTVFMLVIGLMSVYVFLTYFGQNGITRWEYFFGTLISSIGLALTLPIAFILLNLVEMLVIPWVPLTIDVATLSLGSAAMLSLEYILTLMIHFMLGWFITIGFYRYNWMIGLIFIGVVIYAGMMTEALWDDEKYILFGLATESSELSLPIVTAIAVGLILILALVNRRLTKDIVIKM